MPLRDDLMQDMKDAMRAHDSLRLGTIRFLLSQIKNVEIDSGAQTDAQVQDIVRKQIKQMKEAVVEYEKGGRTDLTEEENKKIAVLQKYLPQMMAREAVVAIVEKVIAANPGMQMGQVIGAVKQETQGLADGSEIAAIVKEKLTA
jgi:uncharacterized protein YqeY